MAIKSQWGYSRRKVSRRSAASPLAGKVNEGGFAENNDHQEEPNERFVHRQSALPSRSEAYEQTGGADSNFITHVEPAGRDGLSIHQQEALPKSVDEELCFRSVIFRGKFDPGMLIEHTRGSDLKVNRLRATDQERKMLGVMSCDCPGFIRHEELQHAAQKSLR